MVSPYFGPNGSWVVLQKQTYEKISSAQNRVCLVLFRFKKTILRKCEWTSEAQIKIMADEVAFNIPVNNHPSRSARQAL